MPQEPSLYGSWSNEALIRAATADRQDYLPESMTQIEAELRRRGVTSEDRYRVEQEIALDRNLRVRKLTGLRGWLLVFAVTVAGNSVAAILGGAGLITDNLVLGIAALPAWAFGLYGCYVFLLLLRKKNSAPKHASRWLIAGFALTLLYAGIIYLATRRVALTPLYFMGNSMGTLIWLTYLERSERVAATYGKPPRDAQRTD